MSEETQDDKQLSSEGASKNSKPRRRRRRSQNKTSAAPDQKLETKEKSDGSSPRGRGDGESSSGSGSRPRSRRRRSRKRTHSGSSSSSQKRNGRKSHGKRNNRSGQGGGGRRQKSQQKSRTPLEKFGGREPRAQGHVTSNGPLELNPFELFCAYHLGILDDNRYRQQNVREVAKRFRCSPDDIEDALRRFGLDRDSIRQSSYDISLAQLDMQVAPEGIDKKELAKGLFEEFLEFNPKARHAESLARESAQDVSSVVDE